MTVNTQQDKAPTRELTHAFKGSNTEVKRHIKPRSLSLAELTRVAGGPAIDNNNQK